MGPSGLRLGICASSAAALVLLASPTLAHDDAGDHSETPPAASTWLPPTPRPESKDWIQLKSGEWLRGEIDRLRNDVLEFDSDELDDLQVDWDDIIALRTAREHTYRFANRVIVTGTAVMEGDTLSIRTADVVDDHERSQLESIIPGTPSEWNYWGGKISVGLGAQSGNTNSTDISTNLGIRRETALTRFDIGYNGAVGILDDVRNTNSHRASTLLKLFATGRLFFTPLSLEFFQDEFQNIRLRFTPAALIGYDIFQRKRILWNVSLGAGYQYTDFTTEGATTGSTGVVLLQSNLETEATDRIDFDASWNSQIGVPDTGLTNHHAKVVLSIDIFKDLDLDTSFNWDRVEETVPDENGEFPANDDFRISVGLGLDF